MYCSNIKIPWTNNSFVFVQSVLCLFVYFMRFIDNEWFPFMSFSVVKWFIMFVSVAVDEVSSVSNFLCIVCCGLIKDRSFHYFLLRFIVAQVKLYSHVKVLPHPATSLHLNE